MQNPKLLTPTEIQKATKLTASQIRFWSDGRVLAITPSIRTASQGATALWSVGDYYLFTLAQDAALKKLATFTAIGKSVDAIAKSDQWPFWAENRGQLFCAIFADGRVELSYTQRVKTGTRIPDRNGELMGEGLIRAVQEAIQKNRAKLTEEERQK